LSIYPVPFFDELKINSPEILSVHVCDLSGRTIYKDVISEGTTLLNTTCWNAGVYTVTLANSTGRTANRKVVKY
jgi:hypothetical protein